MWTELGPLNEEGFCEGNSASDMLPRLATVLPDLAERTDEEIRWLELYLRFRGCRVVVGNVDVRNFPTVGDFSFLEQIEDVWGIRRTFFENF